MKQTNRALALVLALTLTLSLAGCGIGPKADRIGTGQPSDTSRVATSTRIRLTSGNKDIIVAMYDNQTSRDFLALLPLKLTFADYNGTEKISYLPRDLSRQGAPDGFDPAEGDLCLYAPWGNLALYYHDFTWSPGLIPLGHITSGFGALAGMEGDVMVTVDAAQGSGGR